MKRLAAMTALTIAVALSLTVQSASAATKAATTTCTKATPTTAAVYQSLFDIHTSTWSGGDGGFSVKLPDGRVIWLFSDTFIGPLNADGSRSAGSYLVNNTAIIQNKGCVTPLTGAAGSNGKLTAWVKPTVNDGSYYWISNAWLEGSNLRLLLMHNINDATGFHYRGMDVATFDVSGTTPRLTAVVTTPVSNGTDTGVAWGASVTQDTTYTYVYGTQQSGWDRQVFVARAAKAQLGVASAWRWWNGTSWSTDKTTAAPVIPYGQGVSSGFSIDKNALGTYVLVTHGWDFFTNDTLVFTSKSPIGPWTKVATYPHKPVAEEPGVSPGMGLVYQSDLHPEAVLSSGNSLVTYAVNSSVWSDNMANGRLYGLRFIELPNYNTLK